MVSVKKQKVTFYINPEDYKHFKSKLALIKQNVSFWIGTKIHEFLVEKGGEENE